MHSQVVKVTTGNNHP